MNNPTTKRCRLCGATKPIDYFHRDRTKRDGHDTRCKECLNAIDRAKRNRPRIKKQADPNATEKQCTRCKKIQPITAFRKRTASFDGLMPSCKECDNEAKRRYNQRHWAKQLERNAEWRINNPERNRALKQRHYLKKKYGLTHDLYQAMLEQQDGKCAICGEAYQHTTSGIGPLEVDHDHNTGAVRGLLCRGCNTGIGIFGDSIDILRAAIAYLERAKG